MVRSTNSNIFTGTRKLVGGKKSSKKSSKKSGENSGKKSSKTHHKKPEAEAESTEDNSSVSSGMMELLEEDDEQVMAPEMPQPDKNQQLENIHDVDPLTIMDQVKTDKNGQQIYNNRIGELLGGSELNNLSNLYNAPVNQYHSPISTVQNNLQPEYNQLAQSLLSQQMPMQQMPMQQMQQMQQMPMQQMPMQQMPMQQMQQMPAMYGGGSNAFYNLSKLL